MAKKSISFTPVDIFFSEIERYLNFFVKNISFVVIIASVLGGLIQVIFLGAMSGSFTMFYSPKQGLVDGALFLLYLFCTIILYTVLFLIIVKIISKPSQLKLLIVFTLLIGAILITIFYRLPYLALLLGLPAVVILLLIVSIPAQVAEETTVEEGKTEFEIFHEKIQEKKGRMLSLTLFVLYIYSSFILFIQIRSETVSNIVNFQRLGEKIAQETGEPITMVYVNADYIFYKSLKDGRFIVQKVDNALTKY